MTLENTRRLLAVALLLVCARPVDGASATDRVQRFKMPAPAVSERARSVRVYFPPSYFLPESAAHRYPVVYLLHGWPGSEGNLLGMGHADDTADSLIARGAIPEILMVSVKGTGSGRLGRSYWINGFDGKKRVEDYVTHDVIDWVDGRFRTRPDAAGRGIVGISDGGVAAFNLAFKHPDLFSACGAHSADFLLTKAFGTAGFLGPEPGASRLIAENSPELYVDRLVPQLERQTLYLDCGTQDESIENTRRFERLLVALGVPHVYHEFPGSHTWSYWSRHLHESLLAVAGALR